MGINEGLISFLMTASFSAPGALEKRDLLKRSQKESDERSKFSDYTALTDAGSAKIQEAAKYLLKAEESFSVSLGANKPGFDEHLRGILQQQTADGA